MSDTKPYPKAIDGVSVACHGDLMALRGEEWMTMAPEDEGDDRLWEFSITTGRILRMR